MLYDNHTGFIISEITLYNHNTGCVIYITPNLSTHECTIKDVRSNWKDKRHDMRQAFYPRLNMTLIDYPPRIKIIRKAKSLRNYVTLIRNQFKLFNLDFEIALSEKETSHEKD